tara:strand:+ start:1082 stop:1585 length:504 start_codon:yes stop_codon:yes gene_type:complete
LKKKYIINDHIKASKVRLVEETGNQIGIINIQEARKISIEKGLDLVLISENVVPPICKLVNYGQYMYQQKKKLKQVKKTTQIIKELKMSPKISENDYQVRLSQGVKFLKKKYKIKLTIFFRGREIVHSNIGYELAKRYIEDVQMLGNAENEPVVNGRSLIVIISPKS